MFYTQLTVLLQWDHSHLSHLQQDMVLLLYTRSVHREVYDGVSMRFVRWFDGDAGEFKSRIDILYGYAPVYPSSLS